MGNCSRCLDTTILHAVRSSAGRWHWGQTDTTQTCLYAMQVVDKQASSPHTGNTAIKYYASNPRQTCMCCFAKRSAFKIVESTSTKLSTTTPQTTAAHSLQSAPQLEPSNASARTLAKDPASEVK